MGQQLVIVLQKLGFVCYFDVSLLFYKSLRSSFQALRSGAQRIKLGSIEASKMYLHKNVLILGRRNDFLVSLKWPRRRSWQEPSPPPYHVTAGDYLKPTKDKVSLSGLILDSGQCCCLEPLEPVARDT